MELVFILSWHSWNHQYLIEAAKVFPEPDLQSIFILINPFSTIFDIRVISPRQFTDVLKQM